MKDRKEKARRAASVEPRPKTHPEGHGPGRGERIARRLARAGVASRREAEAMVAAGRVKINGRVLTSPAVNVRSFDRIEVDGAPIPAVERTRLFLFHKPSGYVTTSRDPEGRKTIFDILPSDLPRLVTIGRLDINTEGLLLLTNDGGLARVLELPSTGWLRRYRVRVHGRVDPLRLAQLEEGIAVDGVFYGAISATLDRQQGSNAWLTLGLREGKNREVKNVLGALGLEVTRLIRISYGPFQLGELPEGAVQEIKGRTLRDQLGRRLIEEAGANFEAPIIRPFANRPVRAGKSKPAGEAKKSSAHGEAGRREERPSVNRKEREERREELRDRLQTKPPVRQDRGAASAGKGERPPKGGRQSRTGGRGERSAPSERRSRASNVWMAPGARPVGKKQAEEQAANCGRSRIKPGGDERKQGRGTSAKRDRSRGRGKPRSGRGPGER